LIWSNVLDASMPSSVPTATLSFTPLAFHAAVEVAVALGVRERVGDRDGVLRHPPFAFLGSVQWFFAAPALAGAMATRDECGAED